MPRGHRLPFLLSLCVVVGGACDSALPCNTDANCPPDVPACVEGGCRLPASLHEDVADPISGEGEGEGEGEGDGEGGSRCTGASGLLEAVDVAVGFSRSCVVTCSGELACWGEGAASDPAPAGTDFAQVTVGQGFACARRDAGDASCWGSFSSSYAGPPTDAYGLPLRMKTLSAGQSFVCGLAHDTSALHCWGDSGYGSSFVPPTGAMRELDAGGPFLCGARLDTGATVCGGWTTFDPDPPSLALRDLGVGAWVSCGLDEDDALVCFGDDGDVDLGAGDEPFVDVGVGGDAVCAVRRADGTLACFLDASAPDALLAVPPGAYERVEVGTSHACALRSDGAVLCWGDNDAHGRVDVPPAAG